MYLDDLRTAKEEALIKQLNSLRDNQIEEQVDIEYKQQLPGASDKEKNEVIADVTSLANTFGGHLIYGAVEASRDGRKLGYPEKYVDVAHGATEAFARIEQLLQSSCQPRLHILSKQVAIDPNTAVLIIQVPRSINAPHMSRFQGKNCFYQRSNSGKFKMDREQVRESFFATELFPIQLRKWVNSESGDSLQKYRDKKYTLQFRMVPNSSIEQRPQRLDLSDDTLLSQLRPLGNSGYVGGWSGRFTLDGYKIVWGPDSHGHFELRKNGIVSYGIHRNPQDDKNSLSIPWLEHLILEFAVRSTKLLELGGVEGPYQLVVMIFGTKDGQLSVGSEIFEDDDHLIDRGALLFEPLEILNSNFDLKTTFRPLFDDLHRAGNWKKCNCLDITGSHSVESFLNKLRMLPELQ